MSKVHEFETFRYLGPYDTPGLRQEEPSCFNRIVRVRRYRITVELIDEPVSVIRERLLKLWHSSDNHHDMRPLLEAASAYGLELEHHDFGKDRRSR